MARRYSRSRRTSRGRIRLDNLERWLVIAGSALYLIGLFGGLGLLAMPAVTTILLLALGGGMGLLTVFLIVW